MAGAKDLAGDVGRYHSGTAVNSVSLSRRS